jgi:hypothetical protein
MLLLDQTATDQFFKTRDEKSETDPGKKLNSVLNGRKSCMLLTSNIHKLVK